MEEADNTSDIFSTQDIQTCDVLNFDFNHLANEIRMVECQSLRTRGESHLKISHLVNKLCSQQACQQVVTMLLFCHFVNAVKLLQT